MWRNKFRFWQKKLSQARITREQSSASELEKKEKPLEDMTKEELIAVIKKLQDIIKSLTIQNAEAQVICTSAQGIRSKDEIQSAKPRLSIH